jgi:hypothetical protein
LSVVRADIHRPIHVSPIDDMWATGTVATRRPGIVEDISELIHVILVSLLAIEEETTAGSSR